MTSAPSPPFRFEVERRCPRTQARTGRFHTPHGVVETPRFMPVGTAATVKGVSTEQLLTTGAQMVLANTFHLHLQPGEGIVADAGGLHRFMGWNGPLLTDSGGFQVFSLADLNAIHEDGVTFRSPRDGAVVELSPERVMAIQEALGADVVMAFDQCPPYPAGHGEVAKACGRTHRWLARCVAARRREDQALFGIVQGGVHEDLRRRSAAEVVAFDLPGCAIGGVSVGEPAAAMHEVVRWVTPLLPDDRPRYLMGVGT
ncbi:MAG: tRNA guanosine(34) transglycosylase Tgt, partial [Cyanobacteriota bacterium]|nr:tRNA guanosine(34) transglycosylase Tgt [Cyanobacteriota bacterium]